MYRGCESALRLQRMSARCGDRPSPAAVFPPSQWRSELLSPHVETRQGWRCSPRPRTVRCPTETPLDWAGAAGWLGLEVLKRRFHVPQTPMHRHRSGSHRHHRQSVGRRCHHRPMQPNRTRSTLDCVRLPQWAVGAVWLETRRWQQRQRGVVLRGHPIAVDGRTWRGGDQRCRRRRRHCQTRHRRRRLTTSLPDRSPTAPPPVGFARARRMQEAWGRSRRTQPFL